MSAACRLCCCAAAVLALIAREATGDVTTVQLNAAIESGVDFLVTRQRTDGRWTDFESEPGGATALCTLALLKCGRPATDPAVSKALAVLSRQPDRERTYSSALMLMAFAKADSKKYFDRIERLAKGLESRQMRDQDDKGGWTYKGPASGSADNSNSHFAMLALYEAEQSGVKVADQTWQLAQRYWTQPRMQAENGGFGYGINQHATGNMTCAAITSLLIARERLQPAEARIVNNELRCCGAVPSDGHLEKASDWLSDHFSASTNPSHPFGGWWLSYLWSLEHVGSLSGQRYLVTTRGDNGRGAKLDLPIAHDWYREACEQLLSRQHKLTKSWIGIGTGEGEPEVGTAFALLFLSQGRRPVVMARLQHSPPAVKGIDDWNHHRRAVANLVSHVGKQWGRELAWQTLDFSRRPTKSGSTVVDAAQLTVSNLLEIPVIFLSGTQALDLGADQRRALKEYVESGGFLLVEACGCSDADAAPFDRSFRALVQELFPSRALRQLPAEHPVWHAQQKVDHDRLPKDPGFGLWGLDICCGTNLVYCPRSLSCYWELARLPRQEIPERIQGEITQVMAIGSNVLAFATGRQPNERLDRSRLVRRNAGTGPAPGAIVVPLLECHGGADEASVALNRLLQIVEWRFSNPVDYDHHLIAAADLTAKDQPVVFVHGRQALTFSAAERQAIKSYLDDGGFVFAAATCSSKEFADSLRREVGSIYPNARLTPIPPDHPIFTDAFSGFTLSELTLREPNDHTSDEPLDTRQIQTPPSLEGLTINGRLSVVLSPYDITGALSRGASLGYSSYDPIDAARLGANVLLYGLQRRAGRLR